MDAENTHQVFDWLWSSGQLSQRDIFRLPALGIEAVVNLAPPTSSNALPGEAELVTGLGLAYIHIPVEWEQPEPEQFAQFVGVLRAFAGRKVWVHCAKNMRVSAFIYLYRKLVLGENEELASFPMREIWNPNEVWQEFISRVAEMPPAPAPWLHLGQHETMFVQIVKFKLKPDASRESFLDLTEQMIDWLKNKTGFIAYELYEGTEFWSDRIAWENQEFAQDGLKNFLDTAIAKKMIHLVEDGYCSFFGQAVASTQPEQGSPTLRSNGTHLRRNHSLT